MTEEEYLGPYTCIRCLEPTFNDNDICDSCREEAKLEAVNRALAKGLKDQPPMSNALEASRKPVQTDERN